MSLVIIVSIKVLVPLVIPTLVVGLLVRFRIGLRLGRKFALGVLKLQVFDHLGEVIHISPLLIHEHPLLLFL